MELIPDDIPWSLSSLAGTGASYDSVFASDVSKNTTFLPFSSVLLITDDKYDRSDFWVITHASLDSATFHLAVNILLLPPLPHMLPFLIQSHISPGDFISIQLYVFHGIRLLSPHVCAGRQHLFFSCFAFHIRQGTVVEVSFDIRHYSFNLRVL